MIIEIEVARLVAIIVISVAVTIYIFTRPPNSSDY